MYDSSGQGLPLPKKGTTVGAGFTLAQKGPRATARVAPTNIKMKKCRKNQ